jgi:(p)ppGpp synthase/HD superfamily hydrolase
MNMLERAIEIAVLAHAGTKDKNGAPYILHPLRVMMRVESDLEKTVAILHDVVEDSKEPNRWGFEELRQEGFGEDVLSALECVTKRENEPYEEFIRRAIPNPVALRVKIADLEDNMDIRRLNTLTESDNARFAKYLKAWKTLKAEKGLKPER